MLCELAQLFFFEASGDSEVAAKTVPTSLADYYGERLAEALGLVPTARVWHLGLYRDHQTLKPVTYRHKPPPEPTIERAPVADPLSAPAPRLSRPRAC
jgi:uracil phosphoribosyltransferase